jgi:hypothetical protein
MGEIEQDFWVTPAFLSDKSNIIEEVCHRPGGHSRNANDAKSVLSADSKDNAGKQMEKLKWKQENV